MFGRKAKRIKELEKQAEEDQFQIEVMTAAIRTLESDVMYHKRRYHNLKEEAKPRLRSNFR